MADEEVIEHETRLADIGHHLMMVQKFRNITPKLAANQLLLEQLDRHEANLLRKQTLLRGSLKRLETPDS